MYATTAKTHRRGVPSAKSRKPKKDDSASGTNIKSAAASTPATCVSINGIDIHCEFKMNLCGERRNSSGCQIEGPNAPQGGNSL